MAVEGEIMRRLIEMAMANADDARGRGDTDWQRFWTAWALLLVTVAEEGS